MKPRFKFPREHICIALDVSHLEAARNLIEKIAPHVGYFKVGFELFTSEGPPAISLVRDLGGRVFLDLKFHDIPNTVAQAAAAATKLGVSLLNLHASGGKEMMAKAAAAVAQKAREERIDRPFLVAVTVLTSLDAQILGTELRIPGSVEDQVVHLAKLAMISGMDGVVASPHEIAAVRNACGSDFLIVTPGVRPKGVSADDQKRIMTPKEAIKAGADILVIGRAITGSTDPVEAAKRILEEIT